MNTNEKTPVGQLLAQMLADPGPALNDVFERSRTVNTPKVDCPEPDAKPILELSARRPYSDKGLIDGLWVGRWDTTSDQIFMDPIVSTGPSVGEWKGTVIYGRFKAPTSANYRVAVNFYGYSISMRLSGPWGSSVVSSFDNTPTLLSGECPAAAGETVWFTLSCTGLYLGFAQKIRIFKL
jgi:hypothetical protein